MATGIAAAATGGCDDMTMACCCVTQDWAHEPQPARVQAKPRVADAGIRDSTNGRAIRQDKRGFAAGGLSGSGMQEINHERFQSGQAGQGQRVVRHQPPPSREKKHFSPPQLTKPNQTLARGGEPQGTRAKNVCLPRWSWVRRTQAVAEKEGEGGDSARPLMSRPLAARIEFRENVYSRLLSNQLLTRHSCPSWGFNVPSLVGANANVRRRRHHEPWQHRQAIGSGASRAVVV